MKFCAKPFEHLEIDHRGEVFLCCSGWLPRSIGRFDQGPLDELWNNTAAQDIRRTILDGSFGHCTGCPYLRSGGDTVVERSAVTNPTHLRIIEDETLVVKRIKRINLSYDRTCNLSCPSCRRDVFVASGDTLKRLRVAQASLLTDEVLQALDELYITGSGDPFASTVFRDLLRSLDPERFPNLTVLLHTNALLFDESAWQTLGKAQEVIKSVEVSIDAAQPETYAVNRRGGDWATLLQNLDFISSLRRQNALYNLRLSFVVQANNWREMQTFIDMGARLAADVVQFTPLRNWGTFTDSEFTARAVHLPTHPEHAAFRTWLKNVSFDNPLVLLGFDR